MRATDLQPPPETVVPLVYGRLIRRMSSRTIAIVAAWLAHVSRGGGRSFLSGFPELRTIGEVVKGNADKVRYVTFKLSQRGQPRRYPSPAEGAFGR